MLWKPEDSIIVLGTRRRVHRKTNPDTAHFKMDALVLEISLRFQQRINADARLKI